ncbi:D-alanyl-D-alanine carboxypeptidase/D-alanyl-D-alanine-endopeptidase [Soonwooa sp.]|uniref:D-alanyl-D-alanine carboxypeptidase/D-alanyl-D-alanine endopeptidase n=1 Tax=Soonwooa sp. TaxID=1938592 RepID=UPI00262FB082|nr:D-alanyl-D-alanine carboxypeptidase/D-alanyl-D-alanine-endopeptidase [Soonwooa sp.]
MNKFKKYISVLGLGISISIFAQTSAVSSIPQFYEQPGLLAKELSPEKSLLSPKENIEVNINRMFSDPVLRTANWGFVVYDPKTNKIITSYNEATPLIPASTTKLLTTETAYSFFGGDFKWNTQLDYSGTIDENGVLEGNLYVIGSGDPSFGAVRVGALSTGNLVSQFLNAVRDKGIKRVNGEIIVETGVFKDAKKDLPANIVWLDHSNYYLPVGSTKDVDPRNEKLVVKQSNPFNNEKRYFYMSPYTNKMVYADKFEGSGLSTKLAEPPMGLANSLKATMLKSGIPVTGKVTARFADKEPETRETLSNYKSPTLSEIVHYTNQHSDNAFAEALLKCLGFYISGDQMPDSGRLAVRSHLEGKAFDTNGLNYVDGSGYSRSNLVTPIAQVKFLTGLMKEPYYKDYFESLPIAGQSGTLKRMFLNTSNGQIFAKTGTLSRVKTLAGYIKTRSGKTLVFSLLINNYNGTVAQVKDRMEQLLDPTLDL